MGAARKELIEAGRRACRLRLEAMGFDWHEDDIFTLPLARRLFGWVSLSRAVHRRDESMVITPGIGLLHQDVERLVTACAHLPYHRYYPATVQTIAGMLTPELAPAATDLDVIFYPQRPIDEPAERVCQPIHDYAIPWMREHASLEAIYALISSEEFNNSALHVFRRPVIAWMLGRPALARELMHDRLAQIVEAGGRNTAGALDVYGRFAAALEERMAQGPA